MYSFERVKATKLRLLGKSYSEIQKEVHVSKSTLSLWLSSVTIKPKYIRRIARLKTKGQRKGAISRRVTRLREVHFAENEGKVTFRTLTDREKYIVGLALYWAEGSKQNNTHPSTKLIFGNQDARMIASYLHWLRLLGIAVKDIILELYVHQSQIDQIHSYKQWWVEELNIDIAQISHVYIKRTPISLKRKKYSSLYHGLLRVKVRASTSLNRRVQGSIGGLAQAMGNGVIGNTSAFEAEESRIVP